MVGGEDTERHKCASNDHDTARDLDRSRGSRHISRQAAIAPGIPLKVLAVGDSITQGFKSTDGNGYRLHLLGSLIDAGSQVSYVGSQRSGNMENNANDGFVGWTISEIAEGARPDFKLLPNVVLLHAGTNDMDKDPAPEPYDTAPERLASLVDEILGAIPEVTLVVAQIVQSGNPGTRDRIPAYNAAISGILNERAAKGSKILAIDMSSIGVGGSNLIDNLHPNDKRYELMAGFWFEALKQASEKGWITAPCEPSAEL